MSEQAAENETPEAETQGAIDLSAGTDLAFGALMDALAPEEGGGEEGQGGAPAAADGGTGAGAAPAAPGAGEKAGAAGQEGQRPAGTPGAGDAPDAGVSAAGGTDAGLGSGDLPATWTASSADLIPKFGELSNAFEESVTKAYHETALTAMREEYSEYFDALNKHPRSLVGVEVPSIGKEGNEVLRDTADAREWQDAVKQLLVEEVRGRATTALDEQNDYLTTIHSSIELFQNNADLVPGTKEFDLDLAKRFTDLAEPYELRVDGKLNGYSIAVQPIINSLRSQIVAERAKAPAVAATTAVTAPGAGASSSPAPDAPQAGIQSKAGSSNDKEDFTTLFGTLGLPNIKI